MADVSRGGLGLHGIKLFGTTITLQNKVNKQVVAKKNDHHHHQRDQQPEKSEDINVNVHDDQTAEMKRPEKIIACPRCKSMETKFCYFNNYNVNQPRLFCKGCQRYWTAGGALRNVPVGAGRRKAKPPCQELVGFPEGNFMYEANSEVVQQFELEEWRMAAVQGVFRHVFPAVKRRRSGSGGQPCS